MFKIFLKNVTVMFLSGSFKEFFVVSVIAVFPVSKIENEPYWCTRNVPEWQIQNALEILLLVNHFRQKFRKLWEHCKEMSRKLENWEHFECT